MSQIQNKSQDSYRQLKESELNMIERKKEAFRVQAERWSVDFLRSLKCDDVKVLNSNLNITAEDRVLSGTIDVNCSGLRGERFSIPVSLTIEADSIKYPIKEEFDKALPIVGEKRAGVTESIAQIDTNSRAKQIDAEQVEQAKENFAIAAEGRVCSELRKLGFDLIRTYQRSDIILSRSASNGYSGRINVYVKLQDKYGDKKVKIPVTIRESSFELPEEKLLRISILKASTGVQELEKEIKNEVDENIEKIDAEEAYKEEETLKALNIGPIADGTLVKEAGTTSVPRPYIAETLKINKVSLPSSLKIGDVIDIDGASYEITADNCAQLSSQGTGSIWTLKLLNENKEADVIVGS